ncbi:MAG: helix-turn-helix transcriptional regulator [Woeseiaceae bacterium]|nr:helix-turn-helix transcriptional regulator [Woeseiaceae bacterium]
MTYTAYTPRQLGQTLRGQRKAQQITQKDAAKMVGLLPKTISKLELATETRDHRQPLQITVGITTGTRRAVTNTR